MKDNAFALFGFTVTWIIGSVVLYFRRLSQGFDVDALEWFGAAALIGFGLFLAGLGFGTSPSVSKAGRSRDTGRTITPTGASGGPDAGPDVGGDGGDGD